MRDFAVRVDQRVGEELSRRSFASDSGSYRRLLPSGIAHGIGFDNGGKNPLRFRVMLFVNAPDIDGHVAGGHLVRYFTGGTLSPIPREMPCRTPDQLDAALTRVTTCLDGTIEPFFGTIETRAALARALEDQPNLDLYRAQLYSLDRDVAAAQTECLAYLARVTKLLGPGHSELLEASERVRTILASLDTQKAG